MAKFLSFIIMSYVMTHIQVELLSPSFVQMTQDLHVSVRFFHFMRSKYALGISIGSLIFGLISDIFGRRKILLFGVYLMIFSNLLCLFPSSNGSFNEKYYMVLFFLQGIGTAAPIVVCAAIVFDSLQYNEARKIVGINNGAITFGKSLASILGGYLALQFMSWKLSYILFSFGLIILLYMVYQYEENVEESKGAEDVQGLKARGKVISLFTACFQLVSQPSVLVHILFNALMASILGIYIGCSSFIIVNKWGVNQQIFGIYQSIITLVFGIVSYFTGFLINQFGVTYLKRMCFGILFAVFVMLLYIHIYNVQDPILLTTSLTTFSIGAAPLVVMSYSSVMQFTSSVRGFAASLMTTCRTFAIFLGTSCVGYFYDGSIKPLVFIVSLFLLCGLILYVLLLPFVLQKQN